MTVHTPDSTMDSSRFKLAVAVIFLLAAFFRIFGQGWDEGHYFHPDERFIATVMDGRLAIPSFSEIESLFDPANSPLNTRSNGEDGQPQEFAYGSLPFLVTTFLGTIIGALNDTNLLSYANVGQFGRFLTTLVDLGTVGIVILFARNVFSELAAIIAGLLTACSVVLIQLTNFFTVDTWVTFFTIATLYACLHIARSFNLKWTLIAAGLGGAALATKVSVGVLGIPILVAMLIGVRTLHRDRRTAALEYVKRIALAAIPTFLVFLTFEPYALWRPRPFVDDIRRQWEIVNGHFDIPFTRQFVGTISGVNEIENLILWGIAPGFGVAALAATGYGFYLAIRQRDPRYLLLMSWIIPYFYIIASSEARFLRYAAPLVPPLAIIVGHQLSAWWYRSGTQIRERLLPGGAIVTVCGVTIVWAVMFMTVYAGTHPRIEASEWIYENVEPGSTITHEIWDDRLPIGLAGQSAGVYDYRGLDLYSDRSNEEAVDFVAEFLSDADYIVLASQRLSHSIPRLPWRYPVQSEYYRLLEQEKLGFELAHEATNYPGFGPFRINTLRADESFSVYDHPPVHVYRKVDDLSREEIELRFAHASQQPWIPQRTPDEPTLRLNEPISERSANTASDWSAPLTQNSLVAVVAWLLAIGLFIIAGIPLVLVLFNRFADLGLGFAPLIGLLGTGILSWLAWSFDYVRLTPWLAVASLILFAGLVWGILDWRQHWRRLLTDQRFPAAGTFVVFAAAFGFVLILRVINPDLWHPIYGGERPMETAYLNAMAQTGEFPPHDPWFADGEINYYYYGFFLFALVWNLTGIPPEVAYQLSLATVAGVLASGLFSLGATLAGSVLHTRNQRWQIAGGGAAAAVVMFFGNLGAIREIQRDVTLSVNFWDSSRIVAYGISEFPYFSFLYGDLHPHLIAAPLLVLVIGLAYAWIVSSGQARWPWILTWTLSAGVAAGSLTVTNFWDGPTAAVLLLAGLVFPLTRSGSDFRLRLAVSSAVGLSVLILGYGLFARFFDRFTTQTGGLETTSSGTSSGDWFLHFGGLLVPVLIAAAFSFYQRFLRRPLQFLYLALGAGVATVSYLVSAWVAGGTAAGPIAFIAWGLILAAAGATLLESVAQRPSGRISQDLAIAAIAPFIAIAGGLSQVRPVAAISAMVVGVFLALILNIPNRSAALAVGITGASGAGLVLVADLVFIADHLANSDWERMNTIFKLYFQAWTLLGITAGLALIWMLHRAMHSRSRSPQVTALVTGIPLVIYALVMLAYPLFATSDRLNHQMESSPSFPSLQGNDWMNGGSITNQAGDTITFTGDYHAVEWLRENAEGVPVILEASIGAYRGGGSRISSATGFASVLGWEGHQSQQRGGADVAPRQQEAREIYQTDDTDRKHYLLRRYAVDYVVVGDVERYAVVGDVAEGEDPNYYSTEAGLDAFDAMLGEQLELVFESEGTRIYEVQRFPQAGWQ